jgi:hypothetical protein
MLSVNMLLCSQVDVNKLPAPPQASDSATSYVAPGSQAEQVLQDVWQEVLGLSQPPSVEADFFTELGGSSLQVIFHIAVVSFVLDVGQHQVTPQCSFSIHHQDTLHTAAVVQCGALSRWLTSHVL